MQALPGFVSIYTTMKSVSLPILSKAGAAAEPPKGWPLLRLGFRPFYIGGALVAALLVPLWLAIFLGALPFSPAVPALLWHAHEMLFGFAAAIIIGFLMTAGKNWTGLATPRGPVLGALALLWLAARLAGLGGSGQVYALLDVALLPLVAIIFARLLWRAKNYRNLPLAFILMLLAASNMVFHLAVAGLLNISAMTALHAGLALITMIESVMAGRVIPAFTMAANPGLKLVASSAVERSALGLTALALLCWIFLPTGWLGALVLVAAALANALRLLGWRSGRTLGQSILWILHAGYAWIALALLLLAAAQVELLPVSVGVHALGVGATGGLIIGMVTRTARGHTGRPLLLSGAEVLACWLVMTAAASRVLASLVAPQFYATLLILAALAWSLAFLIYLWKFTPWLLQTRLDGKDG
ncbi:MAG: NnrS family protein [Ilumatobacteraceae bacterium]|jgi:uncharacterized protein involved in response to NO|nr:NnrS family protein [Ilumatobacteraceae bacterium]